MKNSKKRGFIFLNTIFFVIIAGFILLSTVQYISLRREIYLGLDESISVLTYSLEDRLRTIDKLYYSLELSVEPILEEKVNAMYMAYNDGHLDDTFIQTLKGEDEFLDLYVIDQSNTVIMSTYPPDLDLNFQDNNVFTNYLDYIRDENKYISERISVATVTSEIKKYVYYSSDDGQFIFEASYSMSKYKDILENDSFDQLTSEAQSGNDFILDMQFYNYFGVNFNTQKSIYNIADLNIIENFTKTLDQQIVTSITRPNGDYNITTQFIPYSIDSFDSSPATFILKLSYTDRNLVEDLSIWIIQQIVALAFIIITFLLIRNYYTNSWLRPLKHLLSAFDDIIDNNLSVRVPVEGASDMKKANNTFNEMANKIETLIEEKETHEKHLTSVLAQVEKSYFETVLALANSIDAKDAYTSQHSQRVMDISMLIGKAVNLSQKDLSTLMYGSLLHDVGKIGIVDRVLNKSGRFTDEEYEIIKRHPQIGYDIIKEIEFLHTASEIVLSHHERIDGSGYPNRIEGQDIPYLAKIVSIADAFEAMTSKRVYRDYVMTIAESFRELTKCAGTQFDRILVNQFISAYKAAYGNDLKRVAEEIESL